MGGVEGSSRVIIHSVTVTAPNHDAAHVIAIVDRWQTNKHFVVEASEAAHVAGRNRIAHKCFISTYPYAS